MSPANLDQRLGDLLADYVVFYQKLRGFHWNVRGPLFFGLHARFEELYLEAGERVDAIAERLAARGQRPPATLAAILERARLEEEPGSPSAEAMVAAILGDLERLVADQRQLVELAGAASDPATANLLEGFADAQEKSAWMLRAFLEA